MTPRSTRASLTCALTVVASFVSVALPAQAERAPISIQIHDNNFDADPADILAVVSSAVASMTEEMDLRSPISIVLSHGDEPITSFRRNSSEVFRVALAVEENRWAQLAYQFSHEFCHVLTLNDRGLETATDWFEESLCEAASLLTLERMAKDWVTTPPYSNWSSYAQSLSAYAVKTRTRPSRTLPRGQSFASWFACRTNLESQPNDRERNGIIANQLLIRLRRDPELLDAMRYMNRGPARANRSFDDFVNEWRDDAPSQDRPAIDALVAPLRTRNVCVS